MKKILIADDSMTARMILKRCMEMIGFKGSAWLEAKDGAEALGIASREKPDLLLIDLNMPRMGGEELLAALKQDPALKAIPVVVVSSVAGDDKKGRLASLGAHGSATKPISPAGLKEALGLLAAA